jgi:2'-5' RNA ligase
MVFESLLAAGYRLLIMRLFVGIDITDEIRERVQKYIEQLQVHLPPRSAKWTRPEGWHVTLKFLGETAKANDIKHALAEVHGQPFELAFRNVGFFTPRSPRVFWAGIDAAEELQSLAGRIERRLAPLGFPPEEKRFSPHLTLSRFGSGRPSGSRKDRSQLKMYDLKQLIDAHPELATVEFGTMTAREFCLYESKLSPQGSEYRKVERYQL